MRRSGILTMHIPESRGGRAGNAGLEVMWVSFGRNMILGACGLFSVPFILMLSQLHSWPKRLF